MEPAKTVNEQLAEAARAASERDNDTATAELRLGDGPRDVVRLPASALEPLLAVLRELAQGHDVAVLPVQAELTTQQAADALNVSRPFVIKLMETGQLPFRRVGTHRRVRLADVLTYKQLDDARRADAADALAAEAQALGLGY